MTTITRLATADQRMKVRRPGRASTALIAVAIVGAAAAFLVVSSLRAATVADQRASFDAYLTALEPLAVDTGRVLELNVKPGLDDLEARSVSADLGARAEGWQRELAAIDQRLADVDTPIELAEATARFREAIAGYIAITEDIAATADQPRAERRAAAGEARQRGTASDEIWDSGASVVQQRARRLSLPAVSWLPEQ